MMSHRRGVLAGSLALLALMPGVGRAQQGTTVTGRVTNEADVPLQGASVSIPTLGVGSYTNADGRYTFIVSAGRVGQAVTLTARRIGYQPKSAQITLAAGANSQDFRLTASPTQLTGVVVTALGIEMEKKALGVSQQTIDSTTLTQNVRTTNLVSSLSGKIAGINVTSASTQGGSARIVIRGATSIGGNNQPLFVVDGIPIDNSNYAD